MSFSQFFGPSPNYQKAIFSRLYQTYFDANPHKNQLLKLFSGFHKHHYCKIEKKDASLHPISDPGNILHLNMSKL